MDRLRIYIFFGFLIIAIGLRFLFFFLSPSKYTDGQEISLKITLLSEPQITGNYQRLTANLASGEKFMISTGRYPEFRYGQTLQISGIAKAYDPQAKKSVGSNKNSLTENKKKNKIFTVSEAKINVVKSKEGTFLAVVSVFRQKIILLFNKTLPPDLASLLLGIVFGVSETMPKAFLESIRKTGVMHVIAASGMNVTMVGGFLAWFFAFFLRRQLALIFSILGIGFYAVFAGLEPSIVRASVMGILVFSAQILGRQTLASYSLFLAGYAMLFFSPSLINDIGFQLSFLATGGLLYIRPIFEQNKKIKTVLERSVIGEDLTITLSAQISTMPILFLSFGSFFLPSVIVNLLILWTIPALMVFGGIGAALGLIFEPLGQALLYLSLPFLLYFKWVVGVFTPLNGTIVQQNLPWQIVLGYYFLLASTVLLFRKRE